MLFLLRVEKQILTGGAKEDKNLFQTNFHRAKARLKLPDHQNQILIRGRNCTYHRRVGQIC